MQLQQLAPIAHDSKPLNAVRVETPQAGPGEVLLRVRACGVCHTELDEIEGRLPPPQLPVIPGHQVVGEVVDNNGTQLEAGTRVGVGWIHRSDGTPNENISEAFVATGCDVNGGYAEYMTVPAAYAVPMPDALCDVAAAPLLCAGAIGYRAVMLAGVTDGEPIGLSGFGGSAHLVLQLCRHLYPGSPVFVFARAEETRRFAKRLGADWVGAHHEAPPQPARAIIDTTPAWQPVVNALAALQPGGRLVINAIRKEARDQNALLALSYHKHMWMEREIKSVANITRNDIARFLPLAAEANITATTQTYELEAANEALVSLKFEATVGAKVLVV